MFESILRLFGSKRRGPYRKRTGDDQLKTLKARYLRRLERENPRRFAELMEREIGLVGTGADPIDQLVEAGEKLRKLKRIVGDDDGDTADKVIDRLPEIMKAVPTVVEGLGRAREMAMTASSSVATEPPRQLPEASQTTQEAEQMFADAIANYVIGQLQGRTPADAAAWILDQRNQDAQALIQLIIATPDEQLLATLEKQAAQVPAYAKVVAWLRAQGEWTFQVAAELRKRAPKAKGTRKLRVL